MKVVGVRRRHSAARRHASVAGIFHYQQLVMLFAARWLWPKSSSEIGLLRQ